VINTEQISPTEFFFSSITEGDAYFWDFGDGTTATGRFPPLHAYSDIGTHEVTLTITNDCGTDTTDIEAGAVFSGLNEVGPESTVRIFPNPTNGDLTVTIEGPELKLLEVYNAVGSLIMEQAALGKREDLKLDIDPGGYFLVVHSRDGATAKKIVIL